MDDSTLKTILKSEISSAIGSYTGTSTVGSISKYSDLSSQRRKAMDYYLGMPFGNETEGRSQVISTEVMDTIEWIMPSMMRVFTSSDRAVAFEPTGPEDEEQAKQETDYTNYVFYKENNGFIILNTWFKDALLQKNGYVKLYPEKFSRSSVEEYEGLTDDEMTNLLMDEELEPLEHEASSMETPVGPVTVHKVKFRRTDRSTRICIVPVPPEEIRISRKSLSVDINESPFVCHSVSKTISELTEMGYPKDVLESIRGDQEPDNQEKIARYQYDSTYPNEKDSMDPSMREITVHECYMKLDYDGDGVAELRKVVMAGNEILENEETDIIPICSLTPIILPHKHHGISLADTVMDLQLIRSTLIRQVLDNIYLANNQRIGAVEGRVNLDDLLESRVGGVVRVKDPSAVFPIQYNPIPPQTFTLLEYIETIKESRTGVTRYNQGMDADSLNKTASGMNQMMSASQQRVEMIARVFAETGVKDLFFKLHGMLIKYSDKMKIVKLRNKYVPVDPREWRNRYNVSISVGLGTGNKEQTVASLMAILNLQKEAVMSGGNGVLVTPQHIYNTMDKLVDAMGFKEGELFFADPQTMPPPQPQPDPQMMMIQAQKAIEDDKRKVDIVKIQSESQSRAMEAQVKERDSMRDAEVNALKAQILMMQANSESIKNDMEMRNKQFELAIKKIESERQHEVDLAQVDAQMAQAGAQIAVQHQQMTQRKAETEDKSLQALSEIKGRLQETEKQTGELTKHTGKLSDLHGKTTQILSELASTLKEKKETKKKKRRAKKNSDGSWDIEEE